MFLDISTGGIRYVTMWTEISFLQLIRLMHTTHVGRELKFTNKLCATLRAHIGPSPCYITHTEDINSFTPGSLAYCNNIMVYKTSYKSIANGRENNSGFNLNIINTLIIINLSYIAKM